MRTRRDALAEGLAAVEDRIGRACAAVGRDRDELTLVVVTKYFPASDVELLAGLGVRDVGENRVQEAVAKYADLPVRGDLTLHFIGQLQSNKARQVATVADVVHSVDRAKLVPALDRGAAASGRRLGALVQVSLDDATGRGGALPHEVPALADRIAQAPHLDLLGVMAVAPLGGDPGAAFARLAEVAARIRSEHPGATWVSAGMSGDLEAAVGEGATHLRVGTAILGTRPSLG